MLSFSSRYELKPLPGTPGRPVTAGRPEKRPGYRWRNIRSARIEQAAGGQVLVQRAHTERPRFDFRAQPDGVGQRAQLRRRYGHHVTQVMREPCAACVTVLDG